ncbi:hypothetical protein SUGI_0955230 [Cryptomeria japonica]|uniref:autophagy-related protein 18a n=1 Tax=Cryptomeria japonica TaxID=3369 RepID=UPI002414C342|nr:autophagy-related protein 18a [Cryptomeria japonica]GLJ45377.1 hypothetical protein SUGI_0955230 [Cryptomeria japonica]
MAVVSKNTNRVHASSQPPKPMTTETKGSSRKVLFVGFNQDYGCVACGTDGGFRVYSCEPFKETFRREFSNGGGIGIVEMLFRCNILAIVGGGSFPRYPSNKVMIWDDHQGRCIGELSFRAQVRAVRLRRDKIAVALEHKIYVYNLADLTLVLQIDTMPNAKGLLAISTSSPNTVLACPGLHRGQVRLEHLPLGVRKALFISAHDSHLACLALSPDGLRLATSSNKGTLVRIFNTLDGTRLQELRRGADRAQIYSLAFSSNAQWLALSSDKGTVHVFGLRAFMPQDNNVDVASLASNQSPKDDVGDGNNSGVSDADSAAILASNPSSSLSFMKGVLPSYFSSEWSFAQFHLPEEMQAIVAFGAQRNTVLIVGTDGSFYKCGFDPMHGGEMIQQEFTKFVRPYEDEPNL